ncbi:hypothetical protein CspHIS471_0700440 [Cutaneotrichosporon sp. HIS471]|nr:hypothetical protein CspHIS471_0700440 [Cutaneotrichosporon sp. HIS471]
MSLKYAAYMADDDTSSTPLDLLLNAISGNGGYAFPDGDGNHFTEGLEPPFEAQQDGGEILLENDHNGDEGQLEKEEEDKEGAPSPRQARVQSTLRDHFAGGRDTFSTVEVWHPKTGQKSYGKERRIIQPPPTLRVSGPLAPLMTYVTLSAHPNMDSEPGRVCFSSQSHRFGLADPDPESEPHFGETKKDERERRTRALRAQASRAGWGSTLPWERSRIGIRGREEVGEGITFPGLWVGEETGKSKEFRLELSVGAPGVEVDEGGQPLNLLEAVESVDADAPLDEAALRHVLGSNSVFPDMVLPQVLESDVDAAVAAAQEHSQHEQPETLETQLNTQSDTLEAHSTLTHTDTLPNDMLPNTHPDALPAQALPPAPWATFVSNPLTIVSKPSQKTARARSMASCLSSSDPFALFVRVNAQTVRTKLLNLDGADTDSPTLTARAAKWTPFRFEVVQRAASPEDERRGRFKLDATDDVVTYGSVVRLVDVTSGVRSDPLRLVRVDKNEVLVGSDVGHPVSELQRVGLVRVKENLEDDMPGARRWYLSSPGALAGAGEVKTSRTRLRKSVSAKEEEPELEPEQQPRKKRKTKRHALARAVIEEEEQGVSASGLMFKAAERRATVDDQGIQSIIETVQDSMCWVLSSVGCFSYTFFNGLGEPGSLPTTSLDPVPRLLVNPTINTTSTPATLQLTLSDFFVPDELGVPRPLHVYLGPIGPLRATTWRSVAPKEKYFDPHSLLDAIPYSGGAEEGSLPDDTPVVRSNFPHSVPHVIVSVQLPPMDELVRAMQPQPPAVPHEEPWLGLGAGELTIQEALHNAHKAAAPDGDMALEPQGEFGVDSLNQLDATLNDAGNAAATASTSISPPLPVGLQHGWAESTIAMHRPSQAVAEENALPVLLVRPDGVGNGIGWSLERGPSLPVSESVGAGEFLL